MCSVESKPKNLRPELVLLLELVADFLDEEELLCFTTVKSAGLLIDTMGWTLSPSLPVHGADTDQRVVCARSGK